MHVKSIELWIFGWWHFTYWYFSDLELVFWMLQYLLFLFLSIYKEYQYNNQEYQQIIPISSQQFRQHLSFIIFFQQNKIIMKHIKTYQKVKPQRHSIAIQQDDSKQSARLQNNKHIANIKYATIQEMPKRNSNKFTSSPSKLVQNLSKAQAQYYEDQLNKKQAPQSRMRGHQINLLKLKDKQFHLTKNIYNISIGQLTNHETYLASLQEEIEGLKNQLKKAQQQQSNLQDGQQSQNHAKTIYSRQSMCGRIYKKNSSNHSQKQSIKGLNHRKHSSSFYKWNPQMEQNQSHHKTISQAKDSYLSSRYRGQIKNPEQNIKRPISNYRVKQKIAIKPIQSYKGKQRQEQNQIEKLQSKQVEPEAPQVNYQQMQINKEIFIKNAEWQIKSIQEDFRSKIMQKLQIPANFPIEAPDITSTLDQYKEKAQNIYSIFGIDVKKCSNLLITRKFKNGVYYQLKPNKNILWYFNGSFYFGQWETDLPTESQKNGFGFQYISNKYIYLGNYKNGMKNGNGTIKIIPKSTLNQEKFTAYDGQWLDGKPHGYGFQIDEKDNKYMGNFINGQKTGKCLLMTKQGLLYQGEIEKGIKNGKGLQKLINGDQYIGEFFQGKFHGYGIYKWLNGSIYQGFFAKGKRDGKGKWKSQNGDQFEGQYMEDVKHGYGKFTWANGEIYEGEFRNDVRHGEGVYRHPSGKMGKFMWKEGQIDYRLYSKQQQEYRRRRQREKKENQSLNQNI